VRRELSTVLAAAGFRAGAGGIAQGAVECFPKQDRVDADGFGNLVALPLARASAPLGADLEPVETAPLWVSSAAVPPPPDPADYRAAREAKRREDRWPVPVDYIERLLRHVPADCQYPDWLRRLGAIQATRLDGVAEADMDARLLDIADQWSSTGGDLYKGRHDVERVYWSLDPAKPGGVGFGTLYALARQNGFEEPAPGSSETPADSVELQLAKGSQFKMQRVEWLWPGWLARGKLHILGGGKGAGKSTLGFDVLAQLTTRRGKFPDGTPAPLGDVLIWSGEDDIEDTILPRLAVAGADLDRVWFIKGVIVNGVKRAFDPAQDLAHLLTKARQLRNWWRSWSTRSSRR
jgi:hypothetical protein